MKRLAIVFASVLSACAHVSPRDSGFQPVHRLSHVEKLDKSERSLKPFDSLEDLRQQMAAVAEARRNLEAARAAADEKQLAELRARCIESAANTLKSEADIRSACAISSLSLAQTVTVSGTTAPSITNNQHSGVDEGDIVKRNGDVLIVLRRGRLFTISIGGGRLGSVAVADAFGPASAGVEPDHTWYDELLVWQHTVIVIGYSYKRGGTEIGLFDLGNDGELQYRATYHVRSDDYYSAANYASRLIGDRLVLFSSLSLPENVNPDVWLPALRRWGPQASSGAFETIAPISRVFEPVAPLGANPTIHALIVCNLATPSLECEGTVVLGNVLSTYYVSPTAAYTWTTTWDDNGTSRSMLYRMPFDGAPVTAIGVAGVPSDQLAFFEDRDDHLNIVVVDDKETIRLLRLPVRSFSDGSVDAPPEYYRPIARGNYAIARFVGAYVIVGTQTYDAEDEASRRIAVAAYEGTSTVSLKLSHRVERIEAIGAHAVVVGANDDDDERLVMTAIRLDKRPAVAGSMALEGASQSEYRSHAFFYRQDTRNDGVFGLPISTPAPDGDDTAAWDRPARIVFIQNRGLTFSTAGALDPAPAKPADDRCRASCIDWYGDARPIFIDGRIFALSGYHVVEGRFIDGRVQRVGRLDFTP